MAALVIERNGSDLAQLVRSCNERWTVREMSERASRQGFSISPSELAAYAADEVDVRPSGRHLRALAAALDMPLKVVQMAASRQFSRAPRATRAAPAPDRAVAVRDTYTPLPGPATSVRADRKRFFLLARVFTGVAVMLSCVVFTYHFFLLLVSDARGAFWCTIALTGAPVVFLTTRLVIYLNAQEAQAPVAFWPADRASRLEEWGLVLLAVNLIVVALAAFVALNERSVFDGQVGRFLDYLFPED